MPQTLHFSATAVLLIAWESQDFRAAHGIVAILPRQGLVNLCFERPGTSSSFCSPQSAFCWLQTVLQMYAIFQNPSENVASAQICGISSRPQVGLKGLTKNICDRRLICCPKRLPSYAHYTFILHTPFVEQPSLTPTKVSITPSHSSAFILPQASNF